MALRPLACLCLLAVGVAEDSATALRGSHATPAAPSASQTKLAASAGPSNDTVPEVACMCEVATKECTCTRAGPAGNLTAEDAELERDLTARAKALSSWWAAQDATTRLTRAWSGPMTNQTAEAELPSLNQTIALWKLGPVHGRFKFRWHHGCHHVRGCVCLRRKCACHHGGGCR